MKMQLDASAMEMKMHKHAIRTVIAYLLAQTRNAAQMDAMVHVVHAQTENHAMKGNASLFWQE